MDWARAWQGVSNIFGGILHGLKSIAKGAINGVIGIINAGISGLNKLKAPDWVPGIGGKSPNISLIPQLARGTNYFKGGLAIVGEQGPELVHLPRGSQVIPNNKTEQMLAPLYASKIAEPAVGLLQGTVTYGSEFAPPEVVPLKGRAIYDEQANWKTSEGSIMTTVNNFVVSTVEKFNIFKNRILEIWDDIKTFLSNPIKGTVNLVERVTKLGNKEKTPGLARGTNYFKGGLAVVGEEGPELVHLPRGSKVTPNDESMGMLRNIRSSGGDTFAFSPQINVIIEGGTENTQAAIPNIERAVEKAIIPAMEKYFYQLQIKRPAITKV